jgi:two-component system OmpR family response regulator
MRLLFATDRQVDAYLLKALREAGHGVEATDQPADGVEMALAGGYEAIVLDWSGPPAAAVDRFVAAARGALVLVILAAAEEAPRAAVLKAGADACFVRPTAFIELEARLEALARLVQRARPAQGLADVEMVGAQQAVRLNGATVALSGREYHLMAYLVAHAGEVIGLERLHRHVWGEASETRPDLVRTYVFRLRRKLQAAGADGRLNAVAGHGYVFEARAGGPAPLPPAAQPS